MSAANKLLAGRYQFIRVLGGNEAGQTLLVADVHYPGHPKCVLRQLRLPTRNPMTLKFILNLLKKKADVLEVIGHHKQIPSTFASFEADYNFYLVQEFIPGSPLQSELAPGKRLSEAAVTALLGEILQVLTFAQEHGVVHGSLRPSKLIRHRSDGRLVVLDFGLIKSVSQEISGKDFAPPPAQISPTNRVYSAPEQYRGEARFCSDHYALGMIAIQALTGLPAEELPIAEHLNVHQEIIALLQGIPETGVSLAPLLTRMVHPDPENRYQKAADILADLDRLKASPLKNSTNPAAVVLPLETSEPTDFPVSAGPTSPQPNWQRLGLIGLTVAALGVALFGLRLPQRLLSAQRIRNAQAAEDANDREAAIEHYSRALRFSPNNARAYADRSQLLFEAGDANAALADITQAIEQSPDEATYPYARANYRLSVGDIQGAIQDYTSAIENDPQYVKAYINRGTARADWGDDAGAIEDYTAAIELDPDRETKAAAYLNRCLSYSNIEQQRLALNDCSEAINLRPSHGFAYQNRGLVKRRLEDFLGALQDYNIAIKIEPNSPDAYYNRGLTRQDLADLTGAREDFSKAISISPSYVFAYYDRGLLNVRLGNRSDALADFQQASELCLELGRTECYEDAQFQIAQLQTEEDSRSSEPSEPE